MTVQHLSQGSTTSPRAVGEDGDDTQAAQRSVVILGAGPAGRTAALYAARATLDPLVLQGAAPGGQLMTTTDVEHDTGCAEGILGSALIERSLREAVASGALPALDPITTAQTVVASFAEVML